MIEIIDFNSWKVYEGASEGSGRSEKVWLKSDTNQIGLFKFPKIDPVDKKETTEHVSEHLAYRIGKILDIPTAKVDIGFRDNRIGSMSHFVCDEHENLIEGISFISGKYPHYNTETMQDEENGQYYCIDHLFNSVPSTWVNRQWLEMMLFDFLIGNADRHQSNWALLVKMSTEKGLSFQVRWCPLYDNGSSLCCYVNDTQLDDLLGKDLNRFNALVDSKSKSLIRVDGFKKKSPTHREVVLYLIKNYSSARNIARQIIEKLPKNVIDSLMDEYPAEILSSKKNKLIRQYLYKKIDILTTLLKEVESNEEIE